MTAGFQRNDLIIVAARPSVGKTAFALNIAQNVATKTSENVAIFSLEMGASQLVQRMLCAEGNIDAQRMRTGALTSEDWQKLTMAMGSLAKAGTRGTHHILSLAGRNCCIYWVSCLCVFHMASKECF